MDGRLFHHKGGAREFNNGAAGDYNAIGATYMDIREKTDNRRGGRRLADDYVQARRHVRGTTTETNKELERTRAGDGRKCHACGEEGHLMRACTKRAMTEQKPQLCGGACPDRGGGSKKSVECYNCGELGHITTSRNASIVGRAIAMTG